MTITNDVSGSAARRRRDGWLRAVAIAVVTLPAAGTVLALTGLGAVQIDALDLLLFGAFYLMTMLGLTAGFHRLFSHRAFVARPVVTAVLGIAGSMAIEGPIVRWVAQHRRHHAGSDGPDDLHSPIPAAAAPGWRDRVRALLHAHVGWMLGPPARIEARRYAPDLLRDPLVAALDRAYLVWVLASLALPALLGGLARGSWAGAWSGFLWGGLVRLFCVHHASWAINSIGHLVGTRPFASGDRSANNALLAVFTLGEGWHNNHHAFPASAQHGLRAWQLDPTAWLIRTLEALGLARDVKRPAPEVIARKLNQSIKRGP